jgi:hypothetical protein
MLGSRGTWWRLLTLATLSVIAIPARAQSIVSSDSVSHRYPGLQPGMRIRVSCRTFGEYRPVGSFVGIHGDTLVLMSESYKRPVRALLDDRTIVEVSASRITGSSKGAAVGGMAGATAGLYVAGILGLVTLLNGAPAGNSELILPVIALGGLGILIGSNVGRGDQTDEWQRLPQATDVRSEYLLAPSEHTSHLAFTYRF